MRAFYRCLLWLHPPVFRRDFAGEMLWIFDQASDSQGALPFLFDGMGSLARQWLLRSGWWKIALALALALVEIFGLLLFGRHRIVEPVANPAIDGIAGFSSYGSIAHQPLTVGIVMCLAVFVTGGLLVMVIGLSLWQKNFAARRRRVAVHRGR